MKKLLSFGLVLMMLLTMTSALATMPSKTTESLLTIATTAQAGAQNENIVIEAVVPAEPVVAEFNRLYEEITVKGTAPIASLPTETQQAVSALFTEEVDLEKFQLNEFAALKFTAPKADELGEVKTVFTFATQYAPSQKVIVMFCLFNGEKDAQGNAIKEWMPLPAVVTADGGIEVAFTAEAIKKLNDAQSVAMAVLSEAIIAK